MCFFQEWAGLTRILIEQFEVKLKRSLMQRIQTQLITPQIEDE